MPDFSGRTLDPVMQAPPGQDAGAHTCTQFHEDDALAPIRPPILAKGTHIGVVPDDHRHVEPGPYCVDQVHVAPRWQNGFGQVARPVRIDGARDADPYSQQLARAQGVAHGVDAVT